MQNKISVVIATYNGQNYLKEQLDSILNQSTPVDEVVIVDDSSSDNTWLILEQYQQKYSGIIKIYRNDKNLGVVKTFERALKYTTGQYIFFSDQDDIWFYNKVESMITNIYNYSLIHSDANILMNNQIKYASLLSFLGTKYDADFSWRLLYEGVHGCCMMMKREVYEAAPTIPEGFIYHDLFYNLVASCLNGVKTLDLVLMSYRWHTNNACGLDDNKSFHLLLKHYAKSYNNLTLIKDLPIFYAHHTEINFYISFYDKFINNKHSSIKFIYNVYKKISKNHAISLVIINLLGVVFLEKLYNTMRK